MRLASYRAQIGILGQDVFPFGSTLRERIAYGRLDAAESDILAAVEHAQPDATVAALPEGPETVMDERGVMLSGGQRQLHAPS